MWDVDGPDGAYIETLNLEVSRTASELQDTFDDLGAEENGS